MENNELSPTKFYGGGQQVADLSSQMSVSAARAIQEVQGQIVMAKKFPRDIFQAEKRILEACKRPTLAKSSQYSYPRGGQMVTGPSIRLAEVLAQNWGNLDFGIRELSQENGESVVEAYCWDLETNVRETKVFTVKHERKAKGKVEKLTDPRDIYELVANNGARRLRACILGIIPQDITEQAMLTCDATMTGKSDKPLIDRVREMVKAFDQIAITKEMIETRVGHEVETINVEELVALGKIFNSIKDGMTKRADWFKVEAEKSETTQSLNERLNAPMTKPTEDKPKEPEIAPELKSKAKLPEKDNKPTFTLS